MAHYLIVNLYQSAQVGLGTIIGLVSCPGTATKQGFEMTIGCDATHSRSQGSWAARFNQKTVVLVHDESL